MFAITLISLFIHAFQSHCPAGFNLVCLIISFLRFYLVLYVPLVGGIEAIDFQDVEHSSRW